MIRATAEDRSLIDRLFAEPQAFDFFQAVHILERSNRGQPVRFRAYNSVSFPASSIVDLRRGESDQQADEMTVAFLGITGPSGVLPRHYTEQLAQIERQLRGPTKYALTDWLDQFNNRLVRLFYEAWKKNRFWIPISLPEPKRNKLDDFTFGLMSVGGWDADRRTESSPASVVDPTNSTSAEHGSLDERSLIRYAGLFGQRRRSAANLRRTIKDMFRIPVEIQQMQGQWLILGDHQTTRIGQAPHNQQLGRDAVVGRRVWEVQNKFRIRLGPLTLEQFHEFLPLAVSQHGGLSSLCELVRLFVGPGLDFDVQLVLHGKETPRCQLHRSAKHAPRLGWNTWLGTRPFQRDPDEARFAAM